MLPGEAGRTGAVWAGVAAVEECDDDVAGSALAQRTASR